MSSDSLEGEMMDRARAAATFDATEMAEVIFGSKKARDSHLSAHARIYGPSRLNGGDSMTLPSIYRSSSREDQFAYGLKAGATTFKDDLENNGDVFRTKSHDGTLVNSNPLGLTLVLFTPFLRLQGTEGQIEKWEGMAERGEIIGCYAQTELSHGSFVNGIETTASFDRETDEFIIHSPTLTSTKYWPGALGYVATHSITMARLLINGKDHGVHGFIIQIRSLSDGRPLPGIELGDIGMKMAYNGIDNGYAIFNHVRIPRTNLLMRYSSVDRDGNYTSVPLRQKLVYGGMLNGRGIIIRHSAFQLAQAVTIATRYSVVRTQGLMSPCTGEQPIINYQHQKHRLLTLISHAYVNIFAWKSCTEAQAAMVAQQNRGNHKTLPYVHMLFCGLKAWSTQTAADGTEDARKMCGGHGYMAISGLPGIVTSTVAMCTFEGENFVMWDQVARYLIKGLEANNLSEDMAYMASLSPLDFAVTGMDLLDHSFLLEIFEHRSKTLAHEAGVLVKASEGESKSRANALNLHSLPLMVAARAHIEVFILASSMAQLTLLTIAAPPTSPSVLAVLRNLISLFALTTIASPLALFSSSFNFLPSSAISEMRIHIDLLLEKLLPEAVALMDAWSFTDATLASAIGCKDGNVYERIMAWTRQLPINVEARTTEDVFKRGWEEHLKGFLERGRMRGEKAKL